MTQGFQEMTFVLFQFEQIAFLVYDRRTFEAFLFPGVPNGYILTLDQQAMVLETHCIFPVGDPWNSIFTHMIT